MVETTAYLGLGSNLGDRELNLSNTVDLLKTSPEITLVRSSSIYQTEPWGLVDQPKFLNSVIEIKTSLLPIALLTHTQTIEETLGRRPGLRFGPRLIDIDILLYGDRSIFHEEPSLQIPHPRMHLRAFVLTPLAELMPNYVIKQFGPSVQELSKNVGRQEDVVIWGMPTF